MFLFLLKHYFHTHCPIDIWQSSFLRNIGTLITAFFIVIICGEKFILYLSFFQKQGQPIRKDGPIYHTTTKKGIPCMGGLLIISSIITSIIVWGDIRNTYIIVLSFVLISFGLLGATDDYYKLKYNTSHGISVKLKLTFQFLFSVITIFIIRQYLEKDTIGIIVFPFFKNIILDLGLFYFLFGFCVISGTSNAVNLTDGLDGLAIGLVTIVSIFFVIFLYFISHNTLSTHLILGHIGNSVEELIVFCCALVGAGLGFLWYNAHPAKVFMGDTGSLALGAVIGTISIITKSEILMLIVGFVFVFETISVIIQVLSYKFTGKRIFKMAPIHHHFEKIGWSEPTIVIRFWIVGAMLSFLCFLSVFFI